MPVSIRPSVVTVSGGTKAYRFVAQGDAITNPEGVAALFIRVFPMATLRGLMPVRTGALRQSLALRQAGGSVHLTGVAYAKHVRVSAADGASVVEVFRELAILTLIRMRVIVRAELRRAARG